MIALVVSLVYLLQVNSKKKWTVYFIGASIYAVFAVGLLCVTFPSPAEQYASIVQIAKTQETCKTERQRCIEAAIGNKKRNDSTLRSKLTDLEQTFAQNPNDLELKQRVQFLRASLLQDMRTIDGCQAKSSSNDCTQYVLDACANMIHAKNDTQLETQFQNFRATKDLSEVINLCNIVAQQ